MLCASITNTQAQEVRLGGGYSGSNVREAGLESWSGRAGYLLGADVILGNIWFVRSGAHLHVRNLNYSIVGTDGNGNLFGTDQEFRYTARSLRVPIHAGFRLIDPITEPAFNLYFFGGPTAMMTLSTNLRNDALNVETRPAQWQVGFGGGVELGPLFVEAGYDTAMSNVFKGQAFTTNPHVNTIYGTAGLRLRLAR